MHSKFSQDLEALLTQLAHHPLTLREVLAETSERSFSLIIGLLALPFLFPMPPGVSSILGSASLLLGLQMAIGRHSPWLPHRVAQFQFPNKFVFQLLNNLQKINKILAKIAKPRWFQVAKSRSVWRINGICIAWLAFLLMLPIPFTNPLPTIVMLLLAVATLETDGLLICIGYILTIIVSLIFALIVYQGIGIFENLLQFFS